MAGMMSGYHGFAGGGQYGFFSVISIVGIVSGLAIIIGAALLRARPSDHFMWGVFILVFALISFVDMGGYFVGAALGLAGGALAISYRPRTSTPQPNPT
jgi:CDP-diglyceride synthetase